MGALELRKATSRNCLERKLLGEVTLRRLWSRLGRFLWREPVEGRDRALSVHGETCDWELRFAVAQKVTPGSSDLVCEQS